MYLNGGRWLNADNVNYLQPDSLIGMNLFMYCGNDPVNMMDTSAHTPEWLKIFLKGLYFSVDKLLDVLHGKKTLPKTLNFVNSFTSKVRKCCFIGIFVTIKHFDKIKYFFNEMKKDVSSVFGDAISSDEIGS